MDAASVTTARMFMRPPHAFIGTETAGALPRPWVLLPVPRQDGAGEELRWLSD